MISNGKHSAKAVDATLGYAKNTSQQIEILFEICGNDPAKGERISYTGSFSGGAAVYTLQAMRLCGWDTGHPVADVCRNTVEIDVVEEEYNGRMRQKVRVFAPREGLRTPEHARMSSADADSFLASLCGDAPAPAAKRAREPGEDDDLNF